MVLRRPVTADHLELQRDADVANVAVLTEAELVDQRRLSHNSYMRFFRSVRSPRTEQHVRTSFHEANAKGRYHVNLLWEDYMQSGENWLQSTLHYNFTRRLTSSKRGRVRWFSEQRF